MTKQNLQMIFQMFNTTQARLTRHFILEISNYMLKSDIIAKHDGVYI